MTFAPTFIVKNLKAAQQIWNIMDNNNKIKGETEKILNVRGLNFVVYVFIYIGWGKSHGNYFLVRRYQSGGKM